MSPKNNEITEGAGHPYSVLIGSKKATEYLRKVAGDQIPHQIADHLERITLTTTTDGTQIYFPCPFKETEATVALKSVEAGAVAALAQLRFSDAEPKREIEVDLERTATFLFSTYIATIAGMGKQDPNVKSKLKSRLLLSSASCKLSDLSRYRFISSTIDSISKAVCQSIRDQDARRLLPYPWLS